MYVFRWINWNLDKIDLHNVTQAEAEFVVNHPLPGYPRRAGGDKFKAWGQTADGAYLQVVYVVEDDDSIFVIHARALNDTEKRQFQRRRRRRRT